MTAELWSGTSLLHCFRRRTPILLTMWPPFRRHSSRRLLTLYLGLVWLVFCTIGVIALTQKAPKAVQKSELPPTQVPSALDANKNSTEQQTIHLLSLQYFETNPRLKRVWKWKDSVLGDGRDFFVPKPRTLTALNEYIVASIKSVEECSVLSNCARFELLLLVNNTDYSSYGSEVGGRRRLEEEVSSCISAQVSHSSTKQGLFDPIFNFDRPEAIDQKALLLYNRNNDDDVSLDWTHLIGVERVCRHVCLIAAGMALRPNRPNRPVPFRPFSSRDAHILLQLKRTSEVCTYECCCTLYLFKNIMCLTFYHVLLLLDCTVVSSCQVYSRCGSDGRKGCQRC